MIRTVVFAEDDEDDQLYFREVFREINADIQIVFVTDGNQLLQLLSNFLPDIVFLGLEMPYKNGLECLVELRRNLSSVNLPVVVFSSTTRPANIQTAYEMGAHLFLHKSSRYSEYSDCLKKILSMDWDHPEKIRDHYCNEMVYHSFN
jgi:DNA-binding NarL/FixJ family response regulator